MITEVDKELLGDYVLSLSHGKQKTIHIAGTGEIVVVKRK